MMLQIVEYLVKREKPFSALGLEMINHNVMNRNFSGTSTGSFLDDNFNF